MNSLRYADRVSEILTATGTGSLALDSVAYDTGYQTFAASGLNNAYVPYCITDDAGNWEVGVGYLWNAGTTLNRNGSANKVLASSNAGAVIDWAAGDKRIDLVMPAALFEKRIYFSSAAPTVNDDYSDGFVDGCLWIIEDPAADDSSLSWAYYLDNGAVGAAVWSPLGPWVNNGTTTGTRNLALASWLSTFCRVDLTGLNGFNAGAWNSARANYCAALGDSANLQNRYSLGIGAGKTTGQTANGGHQAEIIVQAGQTTDATPKMLGYTLDPCFEQHENGAATYMIQIVGYEPATGDSFSKEIRALVSRATGTCTIVAQASTAVGASAGAAAWTATLGTVAYPGTGAEGPSVTVTGEAAKTIEWTATAWRTSAHKAA